MSGWRHVSFLTQLDRFLLNLVSICIVNVAWNLILASFLTLSDYASSYTLTCDDPCRSNIGVIAILGPLQMWTDIFNRWLFTVDVRNRKLTTPVSVNTTGKVVVYSLVPDNNLALWLNFILQFQFIKWLTRCCTDGGLIPGRRRTFSSPPFPKGSGVLQPPIQCESRIISQRINQPELQIHHLLLLVPESRFISTSS